MPMGNVLGNSRNVNSLCLFGKSICFHSEVKDSYLKCLLVCNRRTLIWTYSLNPLLRPLMVRFCLIWVWFPWSIVLLLIVVTVASVILKCCSLYLPKRSSTYTLYNKKDDDTTASNSLKVHCRSSIPIKLNSLNVTIFRDEESRFEYGCAQSSRNFHLLVCI